MVNLMPDGGGSGSAIGHPMINEKIAQAEAAGVIGVGGFGKTRFDEYREYFTTPGPTLSETGQSWIDRLLRPPTSQQGYQPGSFIDRLVGDNLPPEGVRKPGLEEEKQDKDAQAEARGAQAERNAHRARLEELAKRALLIGEDFLPSELDEIWQAAINEAEASSKMGGKHVEPWEILEFWANDPALARKYGSAQPSAPDLPPDPEDLEPRTSTSTSTVTQLSTPEAADAVLRRGLQSTLGRKPTDVEFEAFRTYLNDLESANPTVTESTTISDPVSGDTTSESTTSGGAPSPLDAASQFMEDDDFADEAFAYRMGTEGADIMRALVGGLV